MISSNLIATAKVPLLSPNTQLLLDASERQNRINLRFSVARGSLSATAIEE